METVNVLGTTYTIEEVKISECQELKENNWQGSCNEVSKRILIGDTSEPEYFGKLTEQEQRILANEIKRHEIIHAFLRESGLSSDSFIFDGAWSTNEEMVDWIAMQFPKMLQAFKEVNCL
jgi:hypothetical protein